MAKTKPLILFNGGSFGGSGSYYVAAYSRADCVRLMQRVPREDRTGLATYIRTHWVRGHWGIAMVGISAERGVWFQKDRVMPPKRVRLLPEPAVEEDDQVKALRSGIARNKPLQLNADSRAKSWPYPTKPPMKVPSFEGWLDQPWSPGMMATRRRHYSTASIELARAAWFDALAALKEIQNGNN